MKRKFPLVILAVLLIFFAGLKEAYAASEQALGAYETPLLDKSPNRTANIKLAAQQIEQVVIQPGEVFSFNKIVGKRTVERGFKPASIFENGKVVQGIGGGICQLSSTLYQAVLNAKLKVTEVHRHSLKVSYIAPGKDAAISWGSKDFKFQNNTDSPIRIATEVSSDYVRTTVYKLTKEKPIKIFYNDALLETEPTPFITQGTTYVPLRPLREQMGYLLSWNEDNKQIMISFEDTTINLSTDSLEASVNGELKKLPHPPLIKNGVTFVPLRFLAEHFAHDISWSGEEYAVYIKKQP